MMKSEDEYLLMSGIQHFCFCRRQWALIHIEQCWDDNALTTEGILLHERVHDECSIERRGDIINERGLKVVSHQLRLVGQCDCVEFHKAEEGATLNGYEGAWQPVPIEYKRGSSKENPADRFQLCAEAIALEEMFSVYIPIAYLFYEKTRRREEVLLSEDLRKQVLAMAGEMQEYYIRGYTPKVAPKKHCKSCSLIDSCKPEIYDKDASSYIDRFIRGKNA